MMDSNVAFIVSPPRSGSTLLQNVLGSHSKMATLPESYIQLALHAVVEEMDLGVPVLRWTRSALAEYLTRVSEDTYNKGMRAAANVFYQAALEAKPSAEIFIDKVPEYFRILPRLLGMYESSSFILLVRNPLDTLASMIRYDGVERWPQLALCKDRHRRGCTIDRTPEVLDSYWAIELAHREHPSIPLVRYEDFVVEPASTAEQLCWHLGLEYESEMLNYQQSFTMSRFQDENSASKHERPVTTYIDYWREFLPEESAKSYLEVLGHSTVEALGYGYLLEELNA